MSIKLKELTPDDVILYRKNWVQDDRSPIFMDPDWLSAASNKDETPKYWAFFKENRIVGIFSAVERKGKFLKSIVRPILTPHSGVLLVGKNQTSSVERKILSELEEFIKKSAYDDISIAFPPSHKDILPFKNSFWNIELRLTYQIDLSLPQEKLFKNLRYDKRRNILKAQKDGLSINFTKEAKVMEEMVMKSYERREREVPWIENGLKLLKSYPNSFQVNVLENQKPACSLFIAFDKKAAYYLYGGFDGSLNNYCAGPFAMWNAILKAKQMNLELFDFQGSEVPNIEEYFKSFGSKQNLYTIISHKNMKFKMTKFITNLKS